MGKKLLYIVNKWPFRNHSARAQRIYSMLGSFINQQREVYVGCGQPMLDADIQDIQSYPVSLISLKGKGGVEAMSALKSEVVVLDTYKASQKHGQLVYSKSNNSLQVLDLQDLHALRQWRYRQLLASNPGLDQIEKRIPQTSKTRNPAFKPHTHSKPSLGNYLVKRQSAMWDKAKVQYGEQLLCMKRSDLTITCSDFQYLKLKQIHPELNLSWATFLLPVDSFFEELKSKKFRPFERRRDFVFIGNMKHLPNIDAVNLLIQEVWPRVNKLLNQIQRKVKHQLHIYGSDIPGELYHRSKQLQHKNIKIMGRMEELQSIEKYMAMLAPLRFGAGAKGKIVDSWYNHTPVITTPIGSEGLFLQTPYQDLTDTKNKYYNQQIKLSPEQEKNQQLIRAYYTTNRFGAQGFDELRFGGLWQNYEYEEFAQSCVRMTEDKQLWDKCRLIGVDTILKNHSEEVGIRNIDKGIMKAELNQPLFRKSKVYQDAWKV